MAYEMLLREGQINGMRMRNRIITGPMERAMANRDGSLNQRYIDYLVERARGGASLIQVESTYVDHRGQGNPFQVGCHNDAMLPGITRMVAAVHAEGANVGLELYMGGRQASSTASQRQPIAPSAEPCAFLWPTPIPREMTKNDIAYVIEAFTKAAERCLKAGVDFIHIHGAHGYLLGEFLSPYANKREDEYGGSFENRARFPLEVIAAIRSVVGPTFPLGYRLSATEFVEGGLELEDTVQFSSVLADAGINLIDVSAAIYETFSKMFHGPEAPKGGYVRYAAAIKRAVGDRAAVSVCQRLNDPDFADDVMRKEGLDYISLTRAFHADPHYARKLHEGRRADILPCIGCHACLNMVVARRVTGCATNPLTTFERTRAMRKAKKSANVVVVGGGPAGMQAARMLARQGHQVTLLEAKEEPGGQVRYSGRLAADYLDLVTWLEHQLGKLGVDVRLGCRADADMVSAMDADAIVVATGARGGYAYAPISGDMPCFDLFTALDRPDDDWHARTVIVGGDSASCVVALQLAGRGVEVHVIDPNIELCLDKEQPARLLLMETLASLPTVHLTTETTVEEVGSDYVVVQKGGVHSRIEGVDSVVVGGRVADNGLYEALMERAPDAPAYRIGDAVEPRDIYWASQEAAGVADLIGLRVDAMLS